MPPLGRLALVLRLAAPTPHQAPQVSAELDRERISVGDAVTYTVRIVLDGTGPLRAGAPAADGFRLIGRTQRRETVPGGGEVLVLAFRLRADRPGLWSVGPVRIEHRGGVTLAPAMAVQVTGADAAAGGGGVSARVLALLQQAPAPAGGEVAVSLLSPADTVFVGEQVDLVTAAWFPRSLLARLSRPPALRPPSVGGVYSAVQPSTPGVAASRMVGDLWYDLYVVHQVVFPLSPGPLEVPGAGLTFSVSTARRAGAPAEPYRLASRPLSLVVRPLPPGPSLGPGAGGPAARGLELTYELSPEPARAAEPIAVDLVLSGVGNVSLWPAPTIRWPEGTRGYADRVDEDLRPGRSLLQGAKRFRFSLLADSAGSVALPEVRYPYFDLASSAWREAVARAVVVPVLPSRGPATSGDVLPLMTARPIGLPGARWPPPALLVAALAAGPLWVMARAVRRRHRPPPRRVVGTEADRVVELVRAQVPEPERWDPSRVAAALRRLGIEAAASAELAQLFREISQARFDPGPAASGAAPPPIEPRARRALAALSARLALSVAALLLVGPGALPGQADTSRPPPDSLYRARAFGAAASAYRDLARSAPGRPDLWYNAGAAALAAGQDAQAAAAWLTARRLAPRSPTIRSAWARMARRSAELEQAGWVAPLSVPEVGVLGAAAWLAGWVLLGWRRRRRWAAAFLVTAVSGWGAATGLAWWYRRPLAIATGGAVLREAPHGLAEPTGRVDELMVLRVRASRGAWRLVALASGVTGWVPRPVLAEVPPLDSGP